METLIELFVVIAVLVFVMAALGLPLSVFVKAVELPRWAKFEASTSWGNSWVDSFKWLKIILIKIGQLIILFVLFFINIFVSMFKTLEKKLEVSKK